jgi:hypothetical protein
MAASIATSSATAATPAPADKAESLKVIFSNFGEGEWPRYDCCTGFLVQSADSGRDGGMWLAGMPFVPTEDGHVRKIVVPLSLLSGTNSVNVSLRADANGLPGEVLGHFKTADLPPFGGCCEVQTVFAKGIPVTAGQQYWVVARAIADTAAAWNLNAIRVEGMSAVKDQDGWRLSGPVSTAAFKVLGD